MRSTRCALLLVPMLCIAQTPDKKTVYTGVIDQQGGSYVLAGEEEIRAKAVLRAEGFSEDNFARFIGQRVEILGQLQTEGERTMLIVRSIADIRKLSPESKGK